MWTLLLLACGPRSGPDTPSPPTGPLMEQSQGEAADLAAARAFSASRPLYEQPLDEGALPDTGSLSAAACGACHVDHFADWQRSTHARAWTDAQLQAELTKSGNRWLCLNCHSPLRVQQDLLAIGLVDGDVERPRLVANPDFDPDLRAEGVTCAGCHVRQGVIHGPGHPGRSAPHAVKADPAYASGALCLRCHQAEVTYPGKGFACAFDTGATWAAGPAAAAGQGCVDCHMQTTTRAVALGGPLRSVAQHGFPGSGIPKSADHQPVDFAPGLDLEAVWQGPTVTVRSINARAGHSLPTGDPERWVALRLTFTDAAGAPTGEPWTRRIGQTWRWWPEAERLADDRLPAGGRLEDRVPVPEGAVAATLIAESHRLSAETAAYHKLEDIPRMIETHRLHLTPGSAAP